MHGAQLMKPRTQRHSSFTMTKCELLTLSVVEGVRVGVGVGVVEDEGVEEGDSGKGGRKGRRRGK